MVSKIVGLAAGAMLFASTAAVAQAPAASLSVVRAGAALSDHSSLQEEGAGISTGAIVGVTFALIAVAVVIASDEGESGDDSSESP